MKKFKYAVLLLSILILLVVSCTRQEAPQNPVSNPAPVETPTNPQPSLTPQAAPQDNPPQSPEPIPQPSAAPSNGVKEFKVEAKSWEFLPDTIEVKKGDKVRLLVTSLDVPHGLSIPEYGINERLDPGKTVTVEFTADKTGSFTAFCSVFCGAGHSKMGGQIVVT